MPNVPNKQEQLHIIQHPTHTTSPDIVGTFEPTMPECIDDKRVGRDFDTFCYLKNLKLKYDKSTRSQLLTKRGEYCQNSGDNWRSCICFKLGFYSCEIHIRHNGI